jgi:DNA-binding NarL/FixJ family response regulator
MSIATASPECRVRVDDPSIGLVADRSVVGERLRRVLGYGSIDASIDASSLEELDSLSAQSVDVLLLSVSTDRVRMFETFKVARARFPGARIVALWPDDQRREDRRALKAGVDGLIEESQIETALVATVRAVCSGLVCFPRRMPAQSLSEVLSTREKQALGMLIMGFTNAEIGRRLFLAESTVKSHLSSAYSKLGVRSRKDAAALILDPNEGLGTGILAIPGA